MKIAVTFALVAMVVVSLRAPATAKVFDPETFTLENGMQVVVISNHRIPVVTHMVWYKVGAMDEPPGKSGLAHYLEHLMFKGTKKLKPGQFSKIVAQNGGRENAFTSQDYTGYYQSVAKDRLALMMEIEADRMTNLVLTDEIIEPERNVVLEERSSRTDNNPNAQLSEQAATATYMNHPYRIPIIGWEHEIKSLTRTDLIDFYKKWYAPNNAILVVAGDVTAAEVRPLAEKYYGVIPAKALPPRVEWKEPPLLADRRVEMHHDRVRQPEWSRRYRAPSVNYGNTEQSVALQVLSEILSGGSTSRLYSNLVVKSKKLSGAGAWYSARSRGPGSFGFYGSPLPGGNIGDVEKGIEAELTTLIKDGVTEDEVKNAIARLQASAIYANDSISTPARVLGGALAIGRTVEDVESWPDRIGAVTVTDVNKAIKDVLEDRRSVTSILLPKGGGRS